MYRTDAIDACIDRYNPQRCKERNSKSIKTTLTKYKHYYLQNVIKQDHFIEIHF